MKPKNKINIKDDITIKLFENMAKRQNDIIIDHLKRKGVILKPGMENKMKQRLQCIIPGPKLANTGSEQYFLDGEFLVMFSPIKIDFVDGKLKASQDYKSCFQN